MNLKIGDRVKRLDYPGLWTNPKSEMGTIVNIGPMMVVTIKLDDGNTLIKGASGFDVYAEHVGLEKLRPSKLVDKFKEILLS